MSFLKSVLLGSEGSYNFFGTKVVFQKDPPHLTPYRLHGAAVVSQLASKCLHNYPFRLITQGYAHTFIHAMSCALMNKLLTNQDAQIEIFTNSCTTKINLPPRFHTLPDWKKTIADTAGPMGNIAFASCKLVAATALKRSLSWPVALTLGSGAVIWMSGELLYAYVSASNRDYGNFGDIPCRGNAHLALASTALLSQCALGIFAAIKLAR